MKFYIQFNKLKYFITSTIGPKWSEIISFDNEISNKLISKKYIINYLFKYIKN